MKKKIQMWHIRILSAIYTILSALILVSAASAHDAPPGDEYQMADWMLFTFLLFFGIGFIVFLVALKRGHLREPEAVKYVLFEIDEPDYYSPDWAREEKQNDTNQPQKPNEENKGG